MLKTQNQQRLEDARRNLANVEASIDKMPPTMKQDTTARIAFIQLRKADNSLAETMAQAFVAANSLVRFLEHEGRKS